LPKAAPPPELRIALSLPGEASLGAFQAGAVSALVIAVQRMAAMQPGLVSVDVIGGASSGALTAVLAAWSLLGGRDPVEPLRRAWVTEPSIAALRGRDGDAPLTLDRARQIAREELARPPEASPARQTTPLTLELALTSLRGFTYEVPCLSGRTATAREPLRPAIPAVSYADWSRHTLALPDAGGSARAWSDAADAAIASASHPAGFAPVLLDRSSLRDGYEKRGVIELPQDLALWYTDGGLTDREPLGRCLALAREADEGVQPPPRRLLLLVDPDVDAGPASTAAFWAGGADRPTWAATLARAIRIVVSHSLYEDMRRVEKTNNRINWIRDATEALHPLLRDDDETRAALGAVLERMESEREPWHRGSGHSRRPLSAGTEDEPLEALLERVLRAAAGLERKARVDVDLVTAHPSELAGASYLQFGGFLAERLRAQDFLVGYRRMLVWMEEAELGLLRPDLPEGLGKAACEAVSARARTIPGWIGGARMRRPPLGAQYEILRVGLRAARVALAGRRGRGRA
jgi:predicted acylesterase/phospholipase RssA